MEETKNREQLHGNEQAKRRKLIVLSSMGFIVIILIWILSWQLSLSRSDENDTGGPIQFFQTIKEPLSAGGQAFTLFQGASERIDSNEQ